MKIEPAGHRVIVKPDPLSEIEQKELAQFESLQRSGFEISDQKDKKRKEQAVHTGVVGSVGSQAWIAFALDIIRAKDALLAAGWSPEMIRRACQPWAKEGDRVHFAKYGGYVFSEDGIEYRLLNDEDITAIVRDDFDACGESLRKAAEEAKQMERLANGFLPSPDLAEGAK